MHNKKRILLLKKVYIEGLYTIVNNMYKGPLHGRYVINPEGLYMVGMTSTEGLYM